MTLTRDLGLLILAGALALACGGGSGGDDTALPDVPGDAVAADVLADAALADAPTDGSVDEADTPPPPPITPAACVADPTCTVPILNAHRGNCGGEPENTLAAFLQCEAHGVPMFEVDLRRTADGVVVVMHDDTVDRTTDGETRYPGRTSVDQLTLAEFTSLVIDDARCEPDPEASPDRCHPTSFATLLARTRPGSVLFLDFKAGEPADVATDILTAGAATRVIFFDSDFARLRAYRQAVPGGLVMPRAEAEGDFAAFLVPANDDLDLRWIHGDPWHATPATATLLREHGVRLYFNLFALSDAPFVASEVIDDPVKKAELLAKAHQAMDDAIAAGGMGFGTDRAVLGAEYLYPNGFGVAR